MADPTQRLARDGFVVFDADPRVARWAQAAHRRGLQITADPDQQAKWLRHGGTWFVGVDALDNGPDGAVSGVALAGPWGDVIASPQAWHRAQISVVYPGYPRHDPGESDAAHRFRTHRCAAHMDGLHLEHGRRILREPHGFILGLPLNDSDACPLVVWPGSHLRLRDALRGAIGAHTPIGADVTEAYKAARSACFEAISPITIAMSPGQCVVLDRAVLHGVAPWEDGMSAPPEGRMIAYFRPQLEQPDTWLRD